MNILQLTWDLGNGGAEKFIVELSNELAKEHRVLLCSFKAVEEWMLPSKKLSSNVYFRSLQSKKKWSVATFIILLRAIGKFKPDIIHVHSSLIIFYIVFGIPFVSKTKYLHTIHSAITPAYKKLFGILNQFRYWRQSLTHVCISKDIFNSYKIMFPSLRFANIDNGIKPMIRTGEYKKTQAEIEVLKITHKTKIFLAIGNYSIHKNFTMLARVFKRLEFEHRDCVLIILGRDPSDNQESYKTVAAEKGDQTFQLGLKANVADYLACADALMMSSLKEGMPLVILEAFSMGVPVVSTPAGGIIDLVEDGVNGCLAQGFKEENLYEAVIRFMGLSSQELAKIRKQNKMLFEQRFSMEYCSSQYEKLYNELLITDHL